MKVIHFAVDDKFVPFVQRSFEQAFPGGNSFRVSADPRQPLQFVQPGPDVRVVDASYWTSDALGEELRRFDCLVIHYMIPQFMEGVRRAPDDMLIGWSGWGSDYMYLIEPYLGQMLLPGTQALMTGIESKRQRWHRKAMALGRKFVRHPGNLIPYLARRLSGDRGPRADALLEVIDKIDLVSVCPEEMDMFRRALPAFRGEYYRFCNYSAEETFAVGPERMEGPDILVGNSATPTNNHVELFEALDRQDLGDRRLITPLSYGDSDYGDAIVRIGRQRFGRSFVPIRGYMPLDEYSETISRCGVVVMNHVRQQGGTTIATALYKGARVFMRTENPAMEFYRKMGVELSSVQDDLSADGDRFAPLSDASRAKHRLLMVEYWGHAAAIAAASNLEGHLARKRGAGA